MARFNLFSFLVILAVLAQATAQAFIGNPTKANLVDGQYKIYMGSHKLWLKASSDSKVICDGTSTGARDLWTVKNTADGFYSIQNSATKSFLQPGAYYMIQYADIILGPNAYGFRIIALSDTVSQIGDRTGWAVVSKAIYEPAVHFSVWDDILEQKWIFEIQP
ncbi:hypothetical protein BGX26_010591 [Mortierella sp. AD094]|nr:hypothetical protein BGX26_010591 [Mortierella sp. AD094]